jgi:hypothetical protein
MQYADRLPIGLEEVIKNAPAEVVRGFYEKWYRPEHMAVVVIGDFGDCGKVLEVLRDQLEGCQCRSTAPSPPLPRFESSCPHGLCCLHFFGHIELQQSQSDDTFAKVRESNCLQ